MVKGYENYLKNEVNGSDQNMLVVMLYEGIIKFCNLAIGFIKKGDIQESHNNIIKAQNIIFELMSTLDMDKGGEFSQELIRLYDFIVWHLIEANTYKDTKRIEDVIQLVIPLRDAWRTISTKKTISTQENSEYKKINISG